MHNCLPFELTIFTWRLLVHKFSNSWDVRPNGGCKSNNVIKGLASMELSFQQKSYLWTNFAFWKRNFIFIWRTFAKWDKMPTFTFSGNKMLGTRCTCKQTSNKSLSVCLMAYSQESCFYLLPSSFWMIHCSKLVNCKFKMQIFLLPSKKKGKKSISLSSISPKTGKWTSRREIETKTNFICWVNVQEVHSRDIL